MENNKQSNEMNRGENNMDNYKRVKKEDIDKLFNEYLESLAGPYDDFLVDHILKSDFYLMTAENEEIGYFAICNEDLLTQFYMIDEYMHLAQSKLKNIIKSYDIKNAFVPTCDERFLSYALDLKKEIHLQAYFFKETDRKVKPVSIPKGQLRLAVPSDIEMIKALSDNFFSDVTEETQDKKIYIFEDGDEVYGFGIVVENEIHKDHLGIGMFTVEKHRQKGVGRSIILHLKELCHSLGYKSLPGCWYYNHNSKSTLESCGYIANTRLLRIEF